MTGKDRWTVTVRCPKCAGWGTAHLWQEDGWSFSNGDQSTHIESVPYGFASRRTGGQIAQTELGRELLLPGRLDVLDLVHGLAEPREVPVHLLPCPVGVSRGLVFREAAPGVVAQDVRERELPGGVEALGGQSQSRYRYVRDRSSGHLTVASSIGIRKGSVCTCTMKSNVHGPASRVLIMASRR